MPVQVEDAAIRFPVGYSPWYVYEATILAGETFEFIDLLLANAAGKFVRPSSNNPVLLGGYCFALESLDIALAVDTVIQVAVPGSLVPFVAGETLQPEELIVLGVDTGSDDEQTAEAAVAADIGTGKVIGRYRNQNTNAQNLRLAEDQDIIYILSGVI